MTEPSAERIQFEKVARRFDVAVTRQRLNGVPVDVHQTRREALPFLSRCPSSRVRIICSRRRRLA
jgi:hypothetical protein